MKNFTQELKKIIKEDPGVPIMDPDELRARSQTIVILTDEAPKELLALAGPDRKATLLSIDPPMITLPYQKGVFKVSQDAIVFENHHSGRDVSEAGADETPYEKFFSQAMKKFGVSSPIELDPEDTKKFFNYVDKNWEAEEETDADTNEILPAIGAALGGIARGVASVGGAAVRGAASGIGAGLAGGDEDENEDTNEDAEGGMSMGQMATDLGGGTSNGTASILRRPKDDEDDEEATEDVSTGKVGKKDKGSYQHAEKLALKKYQIHSADELDTPAERKGFTDYVDRLWKKGDIHRDKKEASIDIGEITPQEKARRKKAAGSEIQKRGSEKAAADKKKGFAAKQKEREAKKAAGEREARQKQIKQKSADVKRTQAKPQPVAQQKPEKPDPGDAASAAKKKREKEKKSGKRKAGLKSAFGKIAGAAKQQVGQYQKNASIPEGAKKTPGVSKKARGAVGFAKHARKGTGAKRQFQKGVRQAGKKQARNEIAPAVAALGGAVGGGIADRVMDRIAGKDENEVSPPDRKHQVKGIKKHMAQKKGKDKIPKTYVDKKTGKRKETNPWALAWAQYDKYGVPSRIEKD